MALNGRELLEYACAKFQKEKYDEALEAFVLAYSKGTEPEWILDNIYNCYVLGNEDTFRCSYSEQVRDSRISYDECMLDFIPYRNEEYYIFDKEEGIFRGVFSLQELRNVEPNPSLREVEYSAVLLEMNWNWKEQLSILSEAKRRKVYVICQDLNRCVSFCKIPEMMEYTRNIRIFANMEEMQIYFHENTDVYLPKVICASEDSNAKLSKILDEEHQYRLTPEGRNVSNVLLTIGIPTHERGNLVLRRLKNLLSMTYDAEVEIVISKNGNECYQEEYKKIAKMTDARMNYYDHGGEIRYVVNWEYVVRMAHGKYVMFVSDEDDVVIDAIEHYLRLFTDYPDLSLVRAKTLFQNPCKERLFGKKGKEAFKYEFTRQNYISGLIVRREDFLEENLLRLEEYIDNPYYQWYPHEWWCAILSQRGDYIQEPFMFICEQDGLPVDEIESDNKETGIESEVVDNKGGLMQIPVFATYKERLKQLEGQLVLLHMVCGNDKEMIEWGLNLIIGKAAHLFELARERNHDVEHYAEMLDLYRESCMRAIDEFDLEKEQKIKLSTWTKLSYINMFDYHQSLLAKQGN